MNLNSLLKGFPEIEDFFKKSSFSNQDLEDLQKEIKTKYTNRVYKQTALSLIKLQTLKFNNLTNEAAKLFEDNNRTQKEKTVEHNQSINKWEEYIIDYKHHNILSIACLLQINSELIVQLLSQNGITKFDHEFLDVDEYKIMKGFFMSKLKAIERKEKQNKRTFIPRRKTFKKSLSKSTSVYDKLINQKVIGKIIYIRKK